MVCRKGGVDEVTFGQGCTAGTALSNPMLYGARRRPIDDKNDLHGRDLGPETVPSVFALLIVSHLIVKVPRTCRGELPLFSSVEG
jgi:hypothetical protein